MVKMNDLVGDPMYIKILDPTKLLGNVAYRITFQSSVDVVSLDR